MAVSAAISGTDSLVSFVSVHADRKSTQSSSINIFIITRAYSGLESQKITTGFVGASAVLTLAECDATRRAIMQFRIELVIVGDG